jgi:hypothetical protein
MPVGTFQGYRQLAIRHPRCQRARIPVDAGAEGADAQDQLHGDLLYGADVDQVAQ